MKREELIIGTTLQYGDGYITIDSNMLLDIEFYWQTGLKPIKITRELLLNLGFKMLYCGDGIEHFFKKDLELWKSESNGYYYRCGRLHFKIEYIHRLQILYYSLYREQLTIKE